MTSHVRLLSVRLALVDDNSTREYSVNVKVDNNGKPVDPNELAKEIQQKIKDMDDQNRRGKGEEVYF